MYGVALSEAIGLWKEKRDLWEAEKISADDYQNRKDAFPLQYASEMTASSHPEKAINTESVTESVLDSKADLATSLRKKDSLLFRSLESRFVILTYITKIPEELQKRICRYVSFRILCTFLF